jgi:hypothetical protein
LVCTKNVQQLRKLRNFECEAPQQLQGLRRRDWGRSPLTESAEVWKQRQKIAVLESVD